MPREYITERGIPCAPAAARWPATATTAPSWRPSTAAPSRSAGPGSARGGARAPSRGTTTSRRHTTRRTACCLARWPTDRRGGRTSTVTAPVQSASTSASPTATGRTPSPAGTGTGTSYSRSWRRSTYTRTPGPRPLAQTPQRRPRIATQTTGTDRTVGAPPTPEGRAPCRSRRTGRPTVVVRVLHPGTTAGFAFLARGPRPSSAPRSCRGPSA